MIDIQCPHCSSYLNIREVVSRCTECGKPLFEQKKEALPINDWFKYIHEEIKRINYER
jgi:DNA-directed RNA polymerase subunit RPC12/RpoP